MTDQFVDAFERHGGSYLGQQKIVEVKWDGLAKVVTRLESGQVVKSDKMLVALGRMANLEDLQIEAAGLQATQRGLLSVDQYCRTAAPHIYAAGDVIGPPALASSAMEQGRRAVCHALGLGSGVAPETIPMGIFTIPEMASVGISEADAVSLNHGAVVGRAKFNEVARGQIAGITDGLLKMVADPNGQRLLGVQIVGEGAAELIHIGQMALINHADVDSFVENIFNFPTLAEAYRIAALDISRKRKKCIDHNRIWQEGSVSVSVKSGEMLATG
jgi:NAD(P) transhydrogenase